MSNNDVIAYLGNQPTVQIIRPGQNIRLLGGGQGPAGALLGREVLTGNRTYYVRSDGSNSNTGLVDTAGGAFLTIQKALDVCATLDLRIFNVTIQVRDGTFVGTCIVNGAWLGSGNVSVVGNPTTPANVVLSTTASANGVIQCSNGGRITVLNLKLTASGAVGLGLYANGGAITYGNLDFGACTNYHMNAVGGGRINATGAALTISGSAPVHALVLSSGYIQCVVGTINLVGTPAFSSSFVQTSRGGGLIEFFNNTFVGSATGKRFIAGALGQIFCNGGGASYYPGTIAGTTDALGVYS